MSKFKIGDRVRLLSDAWSDARKGAMLLPCFGRKGEVGVIIEDGETWDDLKGWYVGEVGEFNRGWFAEEQLEHVDAKSVPTANPKIQATHAAIDRLDVRRTRGNVRARHGPEEGRGPVRYLLRVWLVCL